MGEPKQKTSDKRENKESSSFQKSVTLPAIAEKKLVLQRHGIAARINKNLIVFKYFYFLFYSAAGTTFPFLLRYFYQIGLSGGQVLVLSAVRPVVHLLFAPLWGILGDRYISKKLVVQFSFLIWLLATISMAFLEPTEQVCEFVTINESKTSVINSTTLKTGFFRRRRSVIDIVETPLTTDPKLTEINNYQGGISGVGPTSDEDTTLTFSGSGMGSSSDHTFKQKLPVTKTPKVKLKVNDKTFKPAPSPTQPVKIQQRNTLRQSPERLNHIFVTALFTMAVIELFACPVVVLIDAVLLSKQNDENYSYGQQRVFGSFGYMIFFFIVSGLLRNSLRSVCGEIYADFVICFCFFALVTIITLIGTVKLPPMNAIKIANGTRPFQRLKQIFCTKHFAALFVNICFVGFSHSFLEHYYNTIVMSSDVSYSTSVTVNFFRFIGEPLALFSSSMILNRAGVINVLFGIPVVTAMNLFFSSFITSPWHVITVGFLDGWTFGVSWVAYATYLVGSAPDDCTATVQGCFQSAYWGVGSGLRILVGTSLVTLIGPSTSLRLFTIVAFGITLAFVIGLRNVNFANQNFYTTVVNKFERLCEGKVMCEVMPPIKQAVEYHNEFALSKSTTLEKVPRATTMEKSLKSTSMEKPFKATVMEKVSKGLITEKLSKGSAIDKFPKGTTMEKLPKTITTERLPKAPNMVEKLPKSATMEKVSRAEVMDRSERRKEGGRKDNNTKRGQ